jgi:hypothetical protein
MEIFSMAVYTSNTVVNNGGTAKGVGSSAVLDNLSVARSATVADLSVMSDVDGVAVLNDKPVAPRLTAELAGPAGDPTNSNSVHARVSSRVTKIGTAIRANKWNSYTGAWDSEYPQSGTENYGTDTGRTSPGYMAYKSSRPSVVRKTY